MPAAPGALELLVDGGVEEHDHAARGQPFPVLGQQDRAATGRQHDAITPGQLIDHVAFANPESGLTLALENVGDVDAGARLDLAVAVRERQAKPLCELPADRGLARTHRPDQKDAPNQSRCTLSRSSGRKRHGRPEAAA